MNNENINFTISDNAATRIEQVASSGKHINFFRLRVEGGGCSGFQYEFSFLNNKDEINADEDIIISKNDANVVIDKISLDFVKGSELDFKKELIGSYFTVKNPNAASSCGCGISFSF